MPRLAAQVLASAPERFALAGLSMGGIVAMEVIRQAPERVTGLALLDTNPLAEPEERQEIRRGWMEEARAGGLARVLREDMKPHYVADGPKRSEVLELCLRMGLDLGMEVFERQSLALMGRTDQSETLRHVAVPSLVLCGEADALCPVARHELMAELIPDAELRIIKRAGHLPVLEKPEETIAALAAWLARVD